MSATAEYIERLEALKEGERSRLRRLAGMPLDETLAGFDQIGRASCRERV